MRIQRKFVIKIKNDIKKNKNIFHRRRIAEEKIPMSGQRFAIQKSLKICIFNLLAEQVQRKQKTHKYYKIGLKVSKISPNKHEKLY